MKMTFRWYGDGDKITLAQIRQIPYVSGVVSAVYDVPAGEVWSNASIAAIKSGAEAVGLSFEVVESVPVHEDIKLGAAGCGRYVDNYKENLRRLGAAGVKCVCYNFMPVFDWLRSDLAKCGADGSTSLAYDEEEVLKLDPLKSSLSLPGWDESYTRAQLRDLLSRYADLGEEGLWRNLEVFLKEVVPVAEEAGIKLAIHPDDPPWSVFGLPRIVTSRQNLSRLLALVDSPSNGITLCVGSLGSSADNDITDIIGACKGRIPFAHIRNVRITGERRFEECGHVSAVGALDMYEVIRALYESGFDGYIRPDHGRMLWGEEGKAGYGLYDRALGAAYIYGLWEAVEKAACKK